MFDSEGKGDEMEIAIIASDVKKELMTQLCIAYCGSRNLQAQGQHQATDGR